MRALVKKEAAPGLWLEERPVPDIGDLEVLIKIKKAAICGTDVHIYKWDQWAQATIPVGLTAGHEFMGEIVKVGKSVNTLRVGDRVSGEGHYFCRQCRTCREGRKHLCSELIAIGRNRNGAFADYMALPAQNVFQLPDAIPDHVGALLDPLGNAVHTAASLDIVGEDVLITGAGPVGVMAVAVCRQMGARNIVITDINEGRLEMAKKMGATYCVNIKNESIADAKKNLGMEEGFTRALEMSGAPAALETILTEVSPAAEIALLGILPSGAGIDWDKVIFKGLVLKGIYGREIFTTWYKMIHLLESGLDPEPIITHYFPFEEYEKGFDAMISGESGRVILEVN